MTLIVTAATNEFVFQASDTRLTMSDGRFFDGNVKATIVQCKDAKLVVAFSGLANIPTRVDSWLVKLLTQSSSWKLTFPEVVEIIRAKLSEVASSYIPLRQNGLTVTMAGLGINGRGQKDVAIASISNIVVKLERGRSIEVTPTGKFESHFFNTGDHFTTYISVEGAVEMDAQTNALRRKLSSVLQKARSKQDLDQIMNYIVDWFKLQKRNKNVNKLIGEEYLLTHLDRSYKSSSFCFTKVGRPKHFPNIVGPKGSVEGILIQSSK